MISFMPPSPLAVAVARGGGGRDGIDDGVIARAAAVIAGGVGADLAARWPRVVLQQLGRCQQHAGRAIATLAGIAGDEGILQVPDRSAIGQTLDGFHRGALQRGREHEAAAHDAPVDADGAGAADAVLAAGVRAHQTEIEAEKIDQMPARLNAASDALAVHGQRHVYLPHHAACTSAPSSNCATARASSTRASWRLSSGPPCKSAGGSRSRSSAAWAAPIGPRSPGVPASAAMAPVASTGTSPTAKNTRQGSMMRPACRRARATVPAMA